jgi:hypothetical protein
MPGTAQARGGDLRAFLDIAADLDLWHVGRGSDRFMSYGCYQEQDRRLFPAGLWHGGALPLDIAGISEDTSHAWYAAAGLPQHPAAGSTLPVAAKEGAYSWCKAPRLAGQVVETGALARQVVAGHPLVRDMVAGSGGSVAARVVARLLELALVLPAMEHWLGELAPGEPWCITSQLGGRDGRRRPRRSRARLARPLADRAPRSHPQLPDHRADHLELFAARCRGHAGRAGTGAGGPAGRRRGAAAGDHPPRRAQFRPLHGVYGALRPSARGWKIDQRSESRHAKNHVRRAGLCRPGWIRAEVSVMMTIFGRFLQLPPDRLEILGMLGLLQDVGKLKLPPELAARGPSDDAEMEIYKTHVINSVRILSDTPGLPPELPGLASLHHERYDGAGYPRGLKGDAIAFPGLIAAIVDTFDTLTAPKPLGQGLSPANALSTIYKERGRQFHPALVEQFIQCVGVFPVGSVVELNSGEVAVVIAQNMVRRMQPRIMVVKDMNGNPLRPYKMLDLMKEPKVRPDEPYRIQRSLEYGSVEIDPRELFL